MKASWIGLGACGLVIYLGIVHSMPDASILLNTHALILVIGGTLAISFLTYAPRRLLQVLDFILIGFIFRFRNSDVANAEDLIASIDAHYKVPPTFAMTERPHPFLIDAFKLLEHTDLDLKTFKKILVDRRNATKRHYFEDAKILNNIAKYPPHLGLMGAASGMIHMMTGLGKDGVEAIGASMAVALTATLWGVGMNNFVFLPLSDNSMKAAEDEVYFRDIIIECALQIKSGESHLNVVRTCLNRLAILDRVSLNNQIREHYYRLRNRDAA